MSKTDYLLRGIACNNQIRFFATDTTNTVQTAMDLHQMAPAPALLLGRLLTAAALMGAELKENIHNLTLNIDSDGVLKGAIAIYEPEGNVRGYAKYPNVFDDNIKTNMKIGQLLGKGTLNVVKDIRLKTPIIGTIQLATGEVAEDIAYFYLQSEQVPTAVSLGVLFNNEGKVLSAGGYLIQQLPEANPNDIEKLMTNLSKTPYITDLLDMGLDWEKILDRLIFKEMNWLIKSSLPIRYFCPCNKERFAKALLLLGKHDLETMADGINPICHYCNKQYEFSRLDIEHLIQSLNCRGRKSE